MIFPWVSRWFPTSGSKSSGAAPSNELRTWYGHDPAKWAEFRKRYTRELREGAAKKALTDLVGHARRGRVTLLYSSRVEDINNATVLEKIVSRRLKRASS